MQTELNGRPQAMIAMSGGVDSSVAAYLMQQAGYACMGATMRLYENEDAGLPRGSTCCALDDVEDARRVAYTLGMPHYVFNYKDAFREQVMARFAAAYQRGATPNPCLDCNRYLKFGLLESRARALGCDVLATGHYARVEQLPDGRWTLKKAADPEKDQSYVLAWLTQEQLADMTGLTSNTVTRTRNAVYTPNGKGLNVSFTLDHYGVDTTILGFFAGFSFFSCPAMAGACVPSAVFQKVLLISRASSCCIP